jgi:hypothetical protein
MAEPIGTWQAFRSHYATTNPGRPVQEASAAWTAYKARHGIQASTPRRSQGRRSQGMRSPKRSPKRSPLRASSPIPARSPPKTQMQRMIAPTLAGLPKDLLENVTRYLSPGSVGRLATLSSAMAAKSRQAVQALCKDLPSADELLAYFRSRVEARVPVSIDVLTLPTSRSPIGIRQLRAVTSRELAASKSRFTAYWVPSGMTIVIAHPNTPGSSLRKELASGLANPYAMLGALRRRESCVKDYLATHGSDKYGLDITREYIRTTLTPLLSTLVDVEASRVFDATVPTIRDEDVVLVPPPDDPARRTTYAGAVAFLGVLLSVWLATPLDRGPGPFDNNLALEEDAPLESFLRMRVRMIHTRYVGGLETLEPLGSSMVDAREVAQYVRRRLARREPFRIGILTVTRDYRTIAAVHSISADGTDVTETYQDDERSGIDIRSSTGKADPKHVAESVALLSTVDPHTLRSVLEMRGGIASPQEAARKYLKRHCHPEVQYLAELAVVRKMEEVVVQEGVRLRSELSEGHVRALSVLLVLLHWAGADEAVTREILYSAADRADVSVVVRALQLYVDVYRSV